MRSDSIFQLCGVVKLVMYGAMKLVLLSAMKLVQGGILSEVYFAHPRTTSSLGGYDELLCTSP